MIGGLMLGCRRTDHPLATEKEVPKKAELSPAHSAATGESTIMLDLEAQKRLALKVEALTSAQLQPEFKGYGRVLDPAPLAALIDELAVAYVTAQTSSKEFERVKLLASQNNTSVRALQASEATARRDQLQAQSLRTRLALTWSQALAKREDLPEFVQSLTTRQSALVRIDLPADEPPPSLPVSARMVSLADATKPVRADFFDESPSVDLQTQGRGFLFLVQPNAEKLAPGAAVTGWLQFPGAPLNGLVVPRSAVIRHQGAGWIYLQANGTNFSRHPISLDRPMEHGWFVTNGVALGDHIVVTGAQILLSEELSAGGAKD